ncbi:mechanosensitive ion channel family protein [Bacteroides sp. 51]|uniref:mechanosensitive ion channel family protein n=1 Tax=Bacteroides sp. 51 TaxID=2302938 RepID=UPI0013D5D4EF|nr:mechanosensitive ion channel family protein [Bacteroides sp. 51]NDV83279.1 mechanosensitive ion channel family protein [Bacteroides sp. 51]
MLEYEFWGNTVENWGISGIIIVVTVILAKLISYLNKKVLIPYTKKTRNKLDDIIIGSIEPPIVFAIVLLGLWIAIHRLVYPDGFVSAVDAAYKILIVLNITWLFARLLNGMIDTYWVNGSSHKVTTRMMPVVRRTILVVVWIIGIVMALSNVGVNISALLGTLGIGGIAFALAAQDTIKNIFGAFTILTDKPFGIGDTIKVDGFEGTIIDVGVRSTKMRTYDKRIVTFPNYKVSDASVENISSEPMRRVVLKLGLTYDTTPEKMNEALNILRDMPNRVQYVSPKDIVANFSDFLDSALVITFIYFIEKKGDIGKVNSNINLEILTSFNKAGLNFAFPSQTLYVEKTEAIADIVGGNKDSQDKEAEQPK